VALPDDIDGWVMTDALTPEYLAAHPITTSNASVKRTQPPADIMPLNVPSSF